MGGTVQRHSKVEGCRKWMDLQTAIVTEEHQTEKQKSLMTSDMWNQKKKKKDTNGHIHKTEILGWT